MKRRIFAFDSVDAARAAVDHLRTLGVSNDAMSLIARSDIEIERVPNELLDASSDLVPALGRGAALGGATGLVAGIVAMIFPPLGIAIGGPMLLGFLGGGALVGAWSGALAGATVPNEVRRKFEDEIAAGKILLVVDDPETQGSVHAPAAMSGLADAHLLWQSETGTPKAA